MNSPESPKLQVPHCATCSCSVQTSGNTRRLVRVLNTESIATAATTPCYTGADIRYCSANNESETIDSRPPNHGVPEKEHAGSLESSDEDEEERDNGQLIEQRDSSHEIGQAEAEGHTSEVLHRTTHGRWGSENVLEAEDLVDQVRHVGEYASETVPLGAYESGSYGVSNRRMVPGSTAGIDMQRNTFSDCETVSVLLEDVPTTTMSLGTHLETEDASGPGPNYGQQHRHLSPTTHTCTFPTHNKEFASSINVGLESPAPSPEVVASDNSKIWLVSEAQARGISLSESMVEHWYKYAKEATTLQAIKSLQEYLRFARQHLDTESSNRIELPELLTTQQSPTYTDEVAATDLALAEKTFRSCQRAKTIGNQAVLCQRLCLANLYRLNERAKAQNARSWGFRETLFRCCYPEFTESGDLRSLTGTARTALNRMTRDIHFGAKICRFSDRGPTPEVVLLLQPAIPDTFLRKLTAPQMDLWADLVYRLASLNSGILRCLWDATFMVVNHAVDLSRYRFPLEKMTIEVQCGMDTISQETIEALLRPVPISSQLSSPACDEMNSAEWPEGYQLVDGTSESSVDESADDHPMPLDNCFDTVPQRPSMPPAVVPNSSSFGEYNELYWSMDAFEHSDWNMVSRLCRGDVG